MGFLRRVRRSLRGCRPKISFGLSLFEDGYCVDVIGYLIALPFLDRWLYEPKEIMDRWGFYVMDRRLWLWYWFMWSPWPALKRQSIDIEFDGEVGERSGSWKGGCIGCGYDMKPGETAEQCLSRMERERIFD